MLSLIFKDFKLLFAGTHRNKLSKVLSILFTILAGVLFLVIEVYLFSEIFKRLKNIVGATDSYFTLFLFVISSLLTVFAILTAKKLFFNQEDNVKLQSLPISNSKIILSKLFFLFMTMYFMNMVFTFPLFVTYGRLYGKMVMFYFKAIFYPIFLFGFQGGVALLLVYPFKLLLDFFKKHLIVQFVVVVVIAFALTFAYSRVLNIFINLVASNNIASLFTTEAINRIKFLEKFMVPINFLERYFVNNSRAALFPSIAIAVGFLAAGLTVSIFAYNKFLQNVFSDSSKKKTKEHQLKSSSVTKALIRKELVILLRNSDFIFSFTGLLMVQPLLSFLIIKSINTIFTSGSLTYYLMAVPNILAFLDIMLMMLMSAIIFQGANNYITNENKNIRLMKSIPVPFFKQLFIKVSIPLIFSVTILLISYLVLAIGRQISWASFGYGLLINLIFIITLAIISLYEELSIKRNQAKNSLLSNIFTYAVPFTYFLIALLMCYNKVNFNLIFLLGFGVVTISLLPFVICFKRRISNKFLSLEVSN